MAARRVEPQQDPETWQNRRTLPPCMKIPRQSKDRGPQYFSVALYDADAPHPYNRSGAQDLLYLRVNVPSDSKAAADAAAQGAQLSHELVKYKAPLRTDCITHRYFLEAMVSSKPIMVAHVSGKVQLHAFKKEHGLEKVSRPYWVDDGTF